MNRQEIETLLPHRERALLLDSAEVYPQENRAVGYLKATTELCEGHFPEYPIVRGVDRVEMIILTLLLAAQVFLKKDEVAVLLEFNKARFPSPAFPGDIIRSESTIAIRLNNVIKGSGKAYVGKKVVAQVEGIILVSVDKNLLEMGNGKILDESEVGQGSTLIQ